MNEQEKPARTDKATKFNAFLHRMFVRNIGYKSAALFLGVVLWLIIGYVS